MDHHVTDEDLEFMRWLDSKEGDPFWDSDENDEKEISQSSWNLAQKEYNRIKGLKENFKSDLKDS